MGGTQRKSRLSGKTVEGGSSLTQLPRGSEAKAPPDLTGMITQVLDKAMNGKVSSGLHPWRACSCRGVFRFENAHLF
jgi:hypothetical protein